MWPEVAREVERERQGPDPEGHCLSATWGRFLVGGLLGSHQRSLSRKAL